jgi:hypothetical protein
MTKARSNAVAEAAKGDLSVGSGTNLAGILAVGSNGETLVADSSTSTGLRYQGSMAAGKNGFINGGFDIWQRGTSFSLAASTSYTGGFLADRFQTSTGANQACTITRQATGDTTNLPNIQYALRYQRNSGQTGTGYLDLTQNFETSNSIPFAGKTVTWSFYARAGANFSGASNGLLVRVYTGTGTDQNLFVGLTGIANPLSTSVTLTTTWQRFSVTFTVGATATQICPVVTHVPTGTAGAADYYEITGQQFEIGSVATNFTRVGGTIQGELAACKYYYNRITAGTVYGYLSLTGGANATTSAIVPISLPIMRVAPTAIDYANAELSEFNGTGKAITTLTINSTQNNNSIVSLTAGGASSLTVDRPYYLRGANNAAGFVGLSAEL